MFQRPYIYTETAFHHEGDEAFMQQMIQATSRTGANGIKFQVLLDHTSFISIEHSAYHLIKTWTFDRDRWLRFATQAADLKLDIIWMPLDLEAVALCGEIKDLVKYIEIHSVSFYDEDLHAAVKKSGIPVLLGVGGRMMVEIDWARDFYGNQLKVLMTGFQAFPSAIEDVRLHNIRSYYSRYPDLAVGYADHTSFDDQMGISANEYAYLLGATIFEKHITVQEGIKRTDFEAAMSEQKVEEICKRLNRLYQIVNSHPSLIESDMTAPEIKYRNRQKVWVAARALSSGSIISREDIVLKMIDQPNGIVDKRTLIGRQLIKDLKSDELITEEFLKRPV